MTADAHQGRPVRDELGRALMAGGALTSDWAPAYAAVPRSAFLPELMWPFDMASGRSVPVSRTDEPAEWHRHADADAPIVTQWDDGRHGGEGPGRVSTSSASMPSVVFSMLRDLDVAAGHRVLEIGTGTGWNAALLAHRLGAGSVYTVEVDGAVAEAARRALGAFGAPVNVVHGDGLAGYPEAAPYDRVIATCGVRAIPLAWVRQCRPGGVIVAPWGTHYGNDDAVARLTVSPDGAEASGTFTGAVEFMKLRAQRLPRIVHAEYVTAGVADGDETSTDVTEAEFVRRRFSAHRFALGLRMPGCHHVVASKENGARPVWFYGLDDRSWACVLFQDEGGARVWQSGRRRLWDEAEAAHRWWLEHGRPEHTRFGLTVRAEGYRAYLDDPDRSWPV
ncbi:MULTISPECIES: methyltransferase domain-containing protein [unclassified Streptomyces]|uniref:methyltransferase domain-containing protein n=1 Tax=unclassified Streptomyces TaxID=2593676 RepID=UPI0022B73CAC|nr:MULTISPECIES: methyltransferase domain-containing protein [unclassified Streptomyces]MCZ7415425.1 methyltransferase domain-containing protein [Streptomyces sp. WMMC897]MCZ7417841.1 methyltransferase domain-containing protein [Streptomyces sp. WMMC897]MCZ7417867.1 methyltransferase domain-containing protein [Streptomyces sp. WMMC897]MCZ7432354.1 methyltransferase domain-containing protein [Streptomyces sp. WMMC1477]